MNKSNLLREDEVNILIVDNDENISKILSTGLENNGFTSYTAPNSDLAISIVKKHTIHFTLLDVQLPVESGIELCKKITSISPTTINIIMTGYPGVKSAVEALRSNAFDYLIKPFRIDTVLAVINRAVREIKKMELKDDHDLIHSLRIENKELKELVKKLNNIIQSKSTQYDGPKSKQQTVELSYQKLIEHPLKFRKKNTHEK